jgi:hypothetical protein
VFRRRVDCERASVPRTGGKSTGYPECFLTNWCSERRQSGGRSTGISGGNGWGGIGTRSLCFAARCSPKLMAGQRRTAGKSPDYFSSHGQFDWLAVEPVNVLGKMYSRSNVFSFHSNPSPLSKDMYVARICSVQVQNSSGTELNIRLAICGMSNTSYSEIPAAVSTRERSSIRILYAFSTVNIFYTGRTVSNSNALKNS